LPAVHICYWSIMKLDVIAIGADIGRAVEEAAAAEQAGYDGYTTTEVNHDPFLPLVQAAACTSRIRLGTCIAGAFSRSPTTLAHLAWDLQAFSGGRFALGLGAQVEAHVTQRFAMPWGPPGPRMRDLVRAVRAVWECWSTGEPLAFESDHYRLGLMPPFFRPQPLAHSTPDILVAAVGERLTEAAGEVADGYIPHAFTTPSYLRERSLPALGRGLARRGLTLEDITIAAPVFVVSGRTEAEMAAAAVATKLQIGFYASEPSYRGVLEHHGWGEAQETLAGLIGAGRLDDVTEVVDDAMLRELAVVAEPDRIVEGVQARFGAVVDRVSFYTPYEADPELWRPVTERLRAA
jgi:probable F420-dependent oxidoreductase